MKTANQFGGTRRRISWSIALGGVVAGLLASVVGPVSGASAGASGSGLTAQPLPDAQPSRGMVYQGLNRSASCPGGFEVTGVGGCTHGPDISPVGVDVKTDAIPLAGGDPLAHADAVCDGDGSTGKRITVIYARSSDKADRYATFASSIKTWANDADAIYEESAQETGGHRRIRFVTDSTCNPIVFNAVMGTTGDDSFGNTISALQGLGFNRSDRKYMLYVDSNVYCGIGNIKGDDQPGAANINNGGPSYGRTDTGCWGGPVAAHELMHNLGGVQLSAPHSSGGWHCVDEYDRMCYSDSPSFPTMQIICPNPARDRLFDCKHDDYYSTIKRPGSYLATHWNSADSGFLISGAQSLFGYVWAFNPTSPSYSASSAYSFNSAGGANTITRSAVGTYQVKFGGMATSGGSVHVTAYGSSNAHCNIGSWFPSGVDQLVNVRCFGPTGAPVDTLYTASFTRPVGVGPLGYAWANSPASASYTPSTTYQYDSAGGAITISRSAVGAYNVLMPGLGGSDGDVQVTAYGSNSRCKTSGWGPSGSSESVGVRCFTPAGAAADSMFVVSYARNASVLGLPGGETAYAWANNSTAASSTPFSSYQFDSNTGTLTQTRSATGVYQIRMPKLAASAGHVTVTAYGSTSSQCKVASWGISGADEIVNVMCFTAAGASADSLFDVSYTRL